MGSLAGRFPTHDISQVEDLLEQVLRAESSWCNLTFEPLEDEEQQPESALFGFLAARGPANPLATVMAATNGRRPRPIEVGIQHRAGVKAAGQLREAQLFVPDGARVAQDHPRRGLVVQWPDTADVAVLAAWLFPAMRVLGRAPTTEAVLYEWNGSAT